MTKILTVVTISTLLLFLLVACSQQPMPAKIAKQLFNPQMNQVAGNPHGSVTLVEFFAYKCGYCRKMYPVVEKLVKQDPYLRVVYKEFLLFGQSSVLPASSALAAGLQHKYLAMHNALMQANKPLTKTEILHLAKRVDLNIQKFKQALQNPQIIAQLRRNTQLSHKLHIYGAPTLIIASTKVLDQPMPTNLRILQYIGVASKNKIQAVINKVHQ